MLKIFITKFLFLLLVSRWLKKKLLKVQRLLYSAQACELLKNFLSYHSHIVKELKINESTIKSVTYIYRVKRNLCWFFLFMSVFESVPISCQQVQKFQFVVYLCFSMYHNFEIQFRRKLLEERNLKEEIKKKASEYHGCVIAICCATFLISPSFSFDMNVEMNKSFKQARRLEKFPRDICACYSHRKHL